MQLLKRVAAGLPSRAQAELKRLHFARQIKRHAFHSPEQEFDMLDGLVNGGDWVIDVGANVGQYTKRLSDLVGSHGRVIAFEPMTATFALLAANVALFQFGNVTLLNAAASDRTASVGMTMPKFDSGLDNFYEAHLSEEAAVDFAVMTLALDSLAIEHRISLVKIDAEGHEASVLAGMTALIKRFRPILIVETGSSDVVKGLVAWGYSPNRSQGSANVVFTPE